MEYKSQHIANLTKTKTTIPVILWEELAVVLVSLTLCVLKRGAGAAVMLLELCCSLFMCSPVVDKPPPWT
jgi:hypothetical protein